MSADVMEDQQPAHKKQKLGASASFDDDLDGFNELNSLEPIGAPESHSSAIPNGNMMNGMATSSAQSLSHMQPQMQFQGANMNSNHTPGSQAQPSVLQELLLSNTPTSSSAMNSPRPPTSFVRAQMAPNAGQNMMSPPTPGMQMPSRGLSQHQYAMRQTAPPHQMYDPAGMSQAGQMPPNFQPNGAPMMANQAQQQHYGNYAPQQMHQAYRQQMSYGGPRQAQPNTAMGRNVMVNGTMQPGARPIRPTGMQMTGGHQQPMRQAIMLNQPGPVGTQGMGQPFDQVPSSYQVPSSMAGNTASRPQMPENYSQSNGPVPHMQPSTANGPGPGYNQMTQNGMVQGARPGFSNGPGQPGQAPSSVPNQNGQMLSSRMDLGGMGQPQSVGSNAMFNGPMSKAAMAPGNGLSIGQQPQSGPSQPGLNQMTPQPSTMAGPPRMQPQSLATPSGSADPEKRKLIQQQLVLLLHAHKCAMREKQGAPPQCSLPHCDTMKRVLDHMATCNNGRQCSYPHCASSRQIITHWKNCSKPECPVCNPLKSFTSGGGRTDISLPSGLVGSPTNVLADFTNAGDAFKLANPPNKVAPVNSGKGNSMAMGMANEGFGNLPTPDPPSQDKPWHTSITQDLRNHLVGKLVKAIFPSPDPAAMHDQRIKDLISYARKVEKEMFEVAEDKEEYYHLLAEKIYKIQKELQEKKNRRLTEQQQQLPSGRMDMSDGIPRPGSSASDRYPPSHATPSTLHQRGVNEIKAEIAELQNITNHSTAVALRNVKNEEMGCSDVPSTSGEVLVKKEERSPQSATAKAPASSVPATPKQEPKEDIPVDEKVFAPAELRNYLKPVWDRLDKMDDAVPFRVPVDAIALGIPDYHDIIKNPMDLSTICSKLDSGRYKNPWEFVDDIWQMFDNAWLYNRKNSKVYKMCTKLSEVFVEEIDPVMRRMGYCCGQRRSFTPLSLFCYGQSMCVIARDQPYHLYEAGSSQYGVTVTERYIYCQKCFDALPPEGINLGDGPNDPSNMAPKEKFKLMKNDQIDLEPFESCKICRRKWHRICANFSKKVHPEGFICEGCRKEKNRPKPDNKFTAKKLPHCTLSRYIEERVNGYIHKNTDDLDSKDQTYEVVIRVLCSTEKEVEVKQMMATKYGPDGFPTRFPYKSKAIFAFEIVDGVEVCFFGLHVQEYGSNCPTPNQRRVYIAYLDSVHFFQPRHLRTDVYHEILLGYLDYVKNLGYIWAHIWACPPSEGDDYIFHCHPPEQKIPKPKRLQDWYKKMLDKGRDEHLVTEYKDIYRQAKDDDLQTPTTLPYFEGDFWPNIIEDCIRDANKEEENERKRMEEGGQQFDDDEDDIFTQESSSKKNSKTSRKKNNLKKSNVKSKKKGNAGTGNQVTDKLFSVLEKHKEVFFTIRLISQQAELTVKQSEISDPDPLMASELMDGRDTFLNRAREEHWEFSSLRRAKWSTVNFCHALHTQDSKEMMSYTCNNCNKTAAFHCSTCDDFDLCATCNKDVQHEHPMEKINQLIEESKSTDASASRNESVKKCIQSLVHACQCRDANCRRTTCQKMKKVVSHTKLCKKRQQTNCPVCRQLIALCCYHAKHCNLAMCPVPFCLNIRQKLQEQKRSQNRRADMMMRRRMEKLHAGGGNGPSAMQTSTHNPPPAASHPAQQPSPHFGNATQLNNGAATMHPGMSSSNSVMMQGNVNGPPGSNLNQPSTSQPYMQQQHHMGGQGGLNQMGQQQIPHYQMQQQQQGMGQMQGGQSMGSQGLNQQQQFMPGQQSIRPSMQNQMNPPPYGRAQQQQQQPSQNFPQNSSQAYANQQPNQMMPNMGPPSAGMSQARGNAMLDAKDPQVREILYRLKQTQTTEERQQIFTELKKTPHLFAAFLKLTNKGGEKGAQYAAAGNQMRQQQPMQQPPPQQQQQQQQQQGGWSQPQPPYSGMPGQGPPQNRQLPPQFAQHQQWSQQQQQQYRTGSPAIQQHPQSFNQVRSPRGTAALGRSPSVGAMVASPLMNAQPPQVMLQQDQTGNGSFR